MSSVPRLQHLTKPLLLELNHWWSRGVPDAYHLEVPGEVFGRWFGSNETLDEECRSKYSSALQEAEHLNIDQIQTLVQSSEEAVGTIILLDQVPRNIFRGKEAIKAHRDFDPKALSLAKRFLGVEGGVNMAKRSNFNHFAKGMFLYMPLMHSESASDHQILAELLHNRLQESESEEEGNGIKKIIDFEDKHHEVIKRFGRYPSRNDILGRETTEEEKTFLTDGAGW